MTHDNFQPPDDLNTEEIAELTNTLPPTLEEAYAEGRADEREEQVLLSRKGGQKSLDSITLKINLDATEFLAQLAVIKEKVDELVELQKKGTE
jgi:hypothetical protein